MTEIADAVRLHLLHCGFVDPDDNTVPIFTGNYLHFAWTSVDKLVDAMLARFDIQDPQRSPLPADETEPTLTADPQAVPAGFAETLASIKSREDEPDLHGPADETEWEWEWGARSKETCGVFIETAAGVRANVLNHPDLFEEVLVGSLRGR